MAKKLKNYIETMKILMVMILLPSIFIIAGLNFNIHNYYILGSLSMIAIGILSTKKLNSK